VLVLLAFFGEKVFEHGNGAGIAVLWTARGSREFSRSFRGLPLRRARRARAAAQHRLGVRPAGRLLLRIRLEPGESAVAAVALAVAKRGREHPVDQRISTLLSRIVPDSIRGRVAAAEMGGFMLALSASTLTVGLLLESRRAIRAR